MKNLKILLGLSLTILIFSFDNGGFEKAMSTNIEAMKNTNNNTELLGVANKFERIGAAEKDQWLPYYYAAYCNIMMTTRETNVTKWDSYLDNADASIAKAEKMNADMVEIYALKGFSSMMRINVDPSVRGQEYSMKAAGFLQQAGQLRDNNPRVVLLMAQMQYGTAKFFGSDTAPICDKFKQAVTLYEQEDRIEDSIAPSWGKKQAVAMVKNCEG